MSTLDKPELRLQITNLRNKQHTARPILNGRQRTTDDDTLEHKRDTKVTAGKKSGCVVNYQVAYIKLL